MPLLNQRGAKATGSDAFPTKAQLDETDVLILHKQEAGNIDDPVERKNLNDFLARGGGLVVIHAGRCLTDPDWFKADRRGLLAQWHDQVARRADAPLLHRPRQSDHQGRVELVDGRRDLLRHGYPARGPDPRGRLHAQAAWARNASSQKRADELTGGGKRVSIYDVQPQMWTYERTAEGGRTPYRAFVSIPGHLYENFNRPNYRAILLRGITWAGKRAERR